jgi:hypothetical protein
MKIPWNDHAVLIRTSRTALSREIITEGLLRDVLDALRRMSAAERDHMVINLPDRFVAPFGYTSREFARLLTDLPLRA